MNGCLPLLESKNSVFQWLDVIQQFFILLMSRQFRALLIRRSVCWIDRTSKLNNKKLYIDWSFYDYLAIATTTRIRVQTHHLSATAPLTKFIERLLALIIQINTQTPQLCILIHNFSSYTLNLIDPLLAATSLKIHNIYWYTQRLHLV